MSLPINQRMMAAIRHRLQPHLGTVRFAISLDHAIGEALRNLRAPDFILAPSQLSEEATTSSRGGQAGLTVDLVMLLPRKGARVSEDLETLDFMQEIEAVNQALQSDAGTLYDKDTGEVLSSGLLDLGTVDSGVNIAELEGAEHVNLVVLRASYGSVDFDLETREIFQ